MILYRYQEPTDDNDPIINQLKNMINSDISASVRQRCVEKIALTTRVLDSVLSRSRDVNVNVRLAAFKRISSIARYLTVPEKRLVLRCGFLDSSEKVTSFVSNVLLANWLQTFENDYFALMKSVRLDACEEDIKETTSLVEKMLHALFRSKSVAEIMSKIKLNEQKLIDYENLNWETALYYRILVQYLRTFVDFEETNTILPELVVFCKFIRGYHQYVKLKKEYDLLEYYFTIKQMFIITEGYDVSDEASRQSLTSLAHFMLQSTQLSVDVSEIVMRNLEKTVPDVNQRSIFVCEIISSIMYGEDTIDYEEIRHQETERQHEISKIKSEILSLVENEQQCKVEKQFQKAHEIKTEMEHKQNLLKSLLIIQEKPELTEKKTDIPTVIRYLTVAEAFLKSPLVKVLTPALSMLCSETIQNVLIHEDSTVKAIAFKCYALCCIIDIKCAKYGIHIFSAPILSRHLIDEDETEILIVSIKAVVDLLSIYGLSLIDKADEEELSDSRRESERKVFIGGTSFADLVEGLANLLEHENIEIQETASRSVCILLLDNRITSPSLVSRIIIKWANPATDNERLKQFIGHTLNILPTLPRCQDYFSDAVITTIRTLTYAPSSSPLSEINVEYIIKFMIALCQLSPDGLEIHNDIAFKICSQMMDKPTAKVNFIYSKTLLFLKLTESEERLNDLLHMCDQLRDNLRNNQISKNIIKFQAKLNEIVAKLKPVSE